MNNNKTKNRLNTINYNSNKINYLNKGIKYILILTVSILMTISIILSLIGKENYTLNIKSNKDIIINNVYIDGIKVDINDYGYVENDKNINVSLSKISSLYLDITCHSQSTNLKYKNIKKNICNNNELKDSVYIKDNYINLVKKYIKSNIVIVIFVFIISFSFNYFLFTTYKKFINEIKNDKLSFKTILLTMISTMIEYMFLFNFLLYYLKYLMIILIFIIVLLILLYLKNSINKKIEYAYLIISIFCGLTMLYVTPPMHIPDEQHHFLKTIVTSNLYKNEFKHDDYGFSYEKENVELVKFIDKYANGVLEGDKNYSPNTYLADLFRKVNKSADKTFIWFSLYTQKFTAYIPASIISFIIQKIYYSPLIVMYFERFINLTLFILATFYTIKKIPKLKKVFCLVSLLPITVQQSFGINQDSINNTLFVILLGIIIRLIYDEKYNFTKKRITLIAILSILLACCKTIYIAILILLLLIPAKKLKLQNESKIHKIIYLGTIIFIILIPCFIFYKYVGLHVPAKLDRFGDFYKIQDAINNPMNFIKIIIKTIILRGTLDTFRGLFDGFGWCSIWNIDIIRDILSVIYTILILTCVSKEEKISKYNHILNIIIFGLLVACIYYALLFRWSNVNVSSIDGLQSRYFIPMLYLLYTELGSTKIIKIQKNSNSIYSILLLLGLIISTISMVHGYIK